MIEKDGRYCGRWYLTLSEVPGVYHVDVVVTDREGRVMESKNENVTVTVISASG